MFKKQYGKWWALALLMALVLLAGQLMVAYAAPSGSMGCDGDDLVIAWDSGDNEVIDVLGTGPGLPLFYENVPGSTVLSGPATWEGITLDDGFGTTVMGSITCPAPVPEVATEEPSPVVPSPTPLPENAIANWEGNPNAPNYDGRLNGEAGEYYSVYCVSNVLFAYDATGLLRHAVLLQNIYTMPPGGSTLNLPGNFTVARSGDDIILGGYDGNNAPAYGEKRFSLAACLQRSGFIPLVAAFSVGGEGQSVEFIDESTGNPRLWRWDFGDGETSTEQNPQHRYGQTGTYTVILTILGAQGRDTLLARVLVGPGPIAPDKHDIQGPEAAE